MIIRLPTDLDRFLESEERIDSILIDLMESAIEIKHLRTLIVSPNASQLRSIAIISTRGSEGGDAAMKILAESSTLGNLVALSASSQGVSPAGMGALAARAWPLEMFQISRTPELGDSGLAALTRAAWLPTLQGLELCSINATSKGWQSFFESVSLPRLVRLVIGTQQTNEVRDPVDEVGDAGIRALTDSSLPSLRVLDVCGAGITDAGVAALATWKGLEQLRRLNLSGNAVTQRGLDALLASPHASGLEMLGISATDCVPTTGSSLDYDGSIMWVGIDEEALARVRAYVHEKLGREIQVH